MEMLQNIKLTFGNKMEIPESIRMNVLIVLLSSGRYRGITLDCFQCLYEEAMHEPLRYSAWGYSDLLEFLRAIPDVRVEYDRKDAAWKVYGMQGPNTFCAAEHSHPQRRMEIEQEPQPTSAVWKRGAGRESNGFDTASVCSTESDPDHIPVDVDKLVVVPDERGRYAVCFPRSKRPSDYQGMRHMFSMAGSVSGIYETTKMVFVYYDSANKARLALKMFSFLDVRLAWRNNGLLTQKHTASAVTTTPRGESRTEMPELRTKVPRMERSENCIVDVMVDNLNIGLTITRAHIEDLFQGYDLQGINIVYNRDLTAKNACIRLGSWWEAEELVSEFDGFDFCGKQLSVYIKDDKFSGPPHEQTFRKEHPAKFEEMHIPEREPVALNIEQLEQMSPLELKVKKTGVEVPAIFVCNFGSMYTEEDVYEWFHEYKPLSVHIMWNDKRLKKAFIELPDKQTVGRAISEMFKVTIEGRQLKVDVPYFLPNLRQEILGSRGRMCTLGPRWPPVIGEAGVMQDLVECRSQVLVSLLQTSSALTPREQLEVIITSVINDTLFFGQVLDRESTESLRHISEEISKPCPDPLPPRRDGPCIVQCKQDNQFCRGWIMGHRVHFTEAEVYCVDSGHLDTVPKQRMRSADEQWMWELPPQAVPFSLADPVVNLQSRLGNHILVEVQCVEKNGMVAAKALSLMPDSKNLLQNVENLLV